VPGERHANGRLVWQEPVYGGPTPETIAQRARLVGIENARDPDAEWLIGRLRITGHITHAECEAGRRYRDDVRRLARLMSLAFDGPRHYRAFDPRPERNGKPEVDDADLRRARDRYDGAFEALTLRGWAARRAVAGAIRDEQVPLGPLRDGLHALRVFYRLPDDASKKG
jgi:hypothetical protein